MTGGWRSAARSSHRRCGGLEHPQPGDQRQDRDGTARLDRKAAPQSTKRGPMIARGNRALESRRQPETIEEATPSIAPNSTSLARRSWP